MPTFNITRIFIIFSVINYYHFVQTFLSGLQLNVPDVWLLSGAIALHAAPVHFCVGMEMVNGGIKKLHILIYFCIMSLSTPIGIIIGMVITEHAGENGDSTKTWVIGILQAIAGGTLLYIAFYEVLDREKLKKAKMTGLLGCLLITIGFYSMAGLEALGML